jgi:hypothetical protein
MTSGDGGGEAGCCGLDGVGNTASGVGMQGFLPAGVATAGAAVAMEGGWAELTPKVEVALPRRDGDDDSDSQPWRNWELMSAGCRKRWRSGYQQRG